MIGDDFINGINDYQPKSNCKKTHVLESNLGFLYTFSIFSIFFPKNPTYVPYLVSFFGFIWGFSFFQQPTSGEPAKRRKVYVAVAFGNAYLTHFSLATLTSGEVAPTTAVPWCPGRTVSYKVGPEPIVMNWGEITITPISSVK